MRSIQKGWMDDYFLRWLLNRNNWAPRCTNRRQESTRGLKNGRISVKLWNQWKWVKVGLTGSRTTTSCRFWPARFVPSALSSDGSGGEWADLYWTAAFHREEVQRGQGDDPVPREDHGDTGGDPAGPHGGRNHSAEEEAHRPGEALAHRRPHPLPPGYKRYIWRWNAVGVSSF